MKCLNKGLFFVIFACVPSLCFGQGTFQITFDGPPSQVPGSAILVQEYSENGMVFEPIGTAGFVRVWANPASFRPDDGTPYLQAGLGSDLMFSHFDGAAFSLVSVDLAEYSTVVPDAVTVSFIGYHPDGSTVTTSFTTDGIIDGTGPLKDFQTFNFGSGWTDLTRVEIPTDGWSLDNLVVTVPEPGLGTLLALWTLAAFYRWTKK